MFLGQVADSALKFAERKQRKYYPVSITLQDTCSVKKKKHIKPGDSSERDRNTKRLI